MMNRQAACTLHALATLAGALLMGCSGGGASVDDASGSTPSPGTALFDAPTTTQATPDSIYGVWGGKLEDSGMTFDTRERFGTSTVTLATRCSLPDGRRSGIVGVTAAARITDDVLAVLESKSDTKNDGVKCSVNVVPQQLKRCVVSETQPAGFERDCFKLEGTTLTQYAKNGLDKIELTKLSD